MLDHRTKVHHNEASTCTYSVSVKRQPLLLCNNQLPPVRCNFKKVDFGSEGLLHRNGNVEMDTWINIRTTTCVIPDMLWLVLALKYN
jgi:hypothetical protein